MSVWSWEKDFTGVDGFLGSNTYVWISLALLLGLPIRRWLTPTGGDRRGDDLPAGSASGGVPQLAEQDRGEAAGQRHRVGGLLAVR